MLALREDRVTDDATANMAESLARLALFGAVLLLAACAAPPPAPVEQPPGVPTPPPGVSAPPPGAPAPSPGLPPTETTVPPLGAPQPPIEARPLPEPRPGPKENVAVAGLVDSARSDAAAGRLPNAAASLERALRIEPRNPRLWQELARVRLKQGDFVQAENLAARSNSYAGSDSGLRAENTRIIEDARAGRR